MKIPVILLLLCCFCAGLQVWPSRQLPCRVYLRFQQGRTIIRTHYLPNYIQDGKFLCCNDAALACCKYLTNHINQYLGTGVAVIRDTAAAWMCNTLQREILPTNPVHVYAYWSISNSPCYHSGSQYLGQLCCWKYTVGTATVYISNPQCTECKKPPCEDGIKNSTLAPVRDPQQSDLIVELNPNPDDGYSPDSFQETPQGKTYPFLSKNLPGFNTFEVSEEKEREEEGGIDQYLETNREHILEANHGELKEFEE